MGSNNAKVVNETEENVTILVFSNSNLVQWHYRNLHYVPPGGEVEVSGLAGGGAIKIGVVYNTYADKYIFDLFRVPDCGTLLVKEINSSREVSCTSTNGGSLEIIQKGQTIPKNADAQEGTKFWLGVTFGAVVAPFVASLTQMGNNDVKVVNETTNEVIIIVFSNSNYLEWHYRDLRDVPSRGEVEISGLPGGGAVKVGIIYKTFEDKYIFDLYRVRANAVLYVKEINASSGVRCTWTDGTVELLRKGQSIQKDANSKEGVYFWLGLVPTVVVAPFIAAKTTFTRRT